MHAARPINVKRSFKGWLKQELTYEFVVSDLDDDVKDHSVLSVANDSRLRQMLRPAKLYVP